LERRDRARRRAGHVVTGEFDETLCPTGPDDFDQTHMDGADETGTSHLAGGWFVPGPCDFQLIDDADAPVAPKGTAVHDHLVALATTTSATTTTTSTTTTATRFGTTPTQTIATPPVTTPPNAPKRRSRRPCVVPQVTGDHLAKAHRRLTASNCRPGRVTGPRRPSSVVAAQYPRSGTRGRYGLRVALALGTERQR
jgi:hypothetical protein